MVKIKMVCDRCEKELAEIEADNAYTGCVARISVEHEGCAAQQPRAADGDTDAHLYDFAKQIHEFSERVLPNRRR